MGHAGQRVGWRARGAVENEAGLPSLDSARDPAGTVRQKQLVGSDGQFQRAIHADTVRPFTSAGEIEIPVGWIRVTGPGQLHRFGPDVRGRYADALNRPGSDLRLK